MKAPLTIVTEERLAELGRNPFEAARIGGLERSFVNDVLKGRKRSIRGENLHKLAKALDLSPEELLARTGLSPSPPSTLRTSSENTDASAKRHLDPHRLRELLVGAFEWRGLSEIRARNLVEALLAFAHTSPDPEDAEITVDQLRAAGRSLSRGFEQG